MKSSSETSLSSFIDKLELAMGIALLFGLMVIGGILGYKYLSFCCSSILLSIVFAGIAVMLWFLYDYIKEFFTKS